MCTTKESIQHGRGFLFVENVGCWEAREEVDNDIGGGFQNAAILWFHLPLLPRHWHMAHVHIWHMSIWHMSIWHMFIWHIYAICMLSKEHTANIPAPVIKCLSQWKCAHYNVCYIVHVYMCTCVHVNMCTCVNVHIRMYVSSQRPLAPTRWSKLRIKIWMITKR